MIAAHQFKNSKWRQYDTALTKHDPFDKFIPWDIPTILDFLYVVGWCRSILPIYVRVTWLTLG